MWANMVRELVIIRHFRLKKQNQFEFKYGNSCLYIMSVNTELYSQSSKLVHMCNVLAVNGRCFVACCLSYRRWSILYRGTAITFQDFSNIAPFESQPASKSKNFPAGVGTATPLRLSPKTANNQTSHPSNKTCFASQNLTTKQIEVSEKR